MSRIVAPRSGHVTDVLVKEGDAVGPGDVLLISELMKMMSEVRAEVAGVVTKVHVARDAVIEENQLLFDFKPKPVSEETKPFQHQSTVPDDLLSELDTRRHAVSDAGRRKRIVKRHQQGGRSARENIADLFDDGSFNELGGHVLAAQHSTHEPEALIEKSASDGVITGTGTMNGKPAAALVVDYTVMAGTQGFFHHKKIDRLLEIAERRKLPLILFPEGGGGRPNDTDAHAIAVAQLEIMTFKNLAALKGKVPIIAAVHGYCFAGSAAFAAVADLIIATQNTSLGMGGPAMIKGGGLGVYHPSEVGPAQMHFENGLIDLLCTDEAEATGLVKLVVDWLATMATGCTEKQLDAEAMDRLLPADRKVVFDVHAVIEAIFDPSSFIALKAAFAPNLIIGMARLDGISCGVLANHSGHMAGAIDGLAAQKAGFLLELCHSNGLPVVSLIDTPGFMVGPEAEATGQIGPIGRFFAAGAKFDPCLVAVVLRRAYGLGAMAMAGGSLHAADTTLSWPSGEFGAMGIEGAVRLGMRDQLAAIDNDEERNAVFDQMVQAMYDKGKALNAATFFEIDDVIKPSETRSRIATILRSLKF